MPHNLNVIFILNNYSYFNKKEIDGPKSIITWIELLIKSNRKVIILIKGGSTIGNFNQEVKVNEFNGFIELNQLVYNYKTNKTIIVSDRANVIPSLILAKLYRLKICIRLLGRGHRLNSKRIISYKSFVKLTSYILEPDLLIETIDGSQNDNQPLIKSKIYIKRMNGIENIYRSQKNNKDYNLYISCSRFSPEKDIIAVISTFLMIKRINEDAKLIIYGVEKKQINKKYHSNSIIFKGYKKRSEIIRSLGISAFFLTGNNAGLLGNAEIEAIASGCKIINATKQKSINDIPIRYRKHFTKSITEEYEYIEHRIKSYEDVHVNDIKTLLNLFNKR